MSRNVDGTEQIGSCLNMWKSANDSTVDKIHNGKRNKRQKWEKLEFKFLKEKHGKVIDQIFD